MVSDIKLRLIIACIVLSILSGVFLPIPIHASGRFDGKRIIFDEDVFWVDRDTADRTLERIKDAGFNVYMPTVWHGRGVTWPSQYAPWDSNLKNYLKVGFDPLVYIIEKAHSMGIEVHPSFSVALRQSELFPEFALPNSSRSGSGAFDVHNPRFRNLIADIVGEVIANYDVDGVNLDYVRAIDLCTTDSCKQEYRQIYGRNLLTDTAVFLAKPGFVPSLIEYQEKAVTVLVKTISDKVRMLKPRIPISVDAIPDVASLIQGQNSIDWVNKNLIDVLFRMDYYRDVDKKLTESIRSRLHEPDALGIMISNISHGENPRGQPHFPRDGKWVADTVSMIQKRWPHIGIAIYFYKSLTDEQIAALKAGPFRLKAPAGLKVN